MNFDPLLIFNAIIATKVNQSSFLEQCESGSNFILARDVRKPQIYVTLTSGSKFISHAYPTRDKVSITFFTGSKFILTLWVSRVLFGGPWIWSDRVILEPEKGLKIKNHVLSPETGFYLTKYLLGSIKWLIEIKKIIGRN